MPQKGPTRLQIALSISVIVAGILIAVFVIYPVSQNRPQKREQVIFGEPRRFNVSQVLVTTQDLVESRLLLNVNWRYNEVKFSDKNVPEFQTTIIRPECITLIADAAKKVEKASDLLLAETQLQLQDSAAKGLQNKLFEKGILVENVFIRYVEIIKPN